MELSLRERLKYQVIARAKLPLAEKRAGLEGSLLALVEAAWPSLDPSRYVVVDNPHANKLTVHILAAVAQHEREMISERTKAARRPPRSVDSG